MSNRTSKSSLVLLLCLLCMAAVCLPSPVTAQEDALTRADSAFKAGDYAVAKPLYEQVFAERGSTNDTPEQREVNTRVLFHLGQCCLGLDLQVDGQQWLNRLISTYAANHVKCAASRILIAKSLIWQMKHDDAIPVLDSILTDYPEERGACARALLVKADLNLRVNRFSSAVDVLKRLRTDYADQSKFYKEAGPMLVRALDNTFRTDEALDLLGILLTSDSYSSRRKSDLLVLKADVLLSASRYAECKQTCQTVLTDGASSASAVRAAKRTLVQALCEDGTEPGKVLSLVRDLISDQSNPDPSENAQYVLWNGFAYWITGDFAKAEECFTKIISDFADQQVMVGVAYFHRARLRATALKAYDAAASDILLIPVPYLKHSAQGELYLSQKQYTEAAAEFEQVISSLPPQRVPNTEPVNAFKEMAQCYEMLGDAARAADARSRLAEYESTHK